MASAWCVDLWHPIDDLTMAEAVANITPTVEENNTHVKAEHLVSDYALSRNIARYGLKFTTLTALWPRLGIAPNFFWHVYTLPVEEKLIEMKKIIKAWGI
jgi:hypothetical protein